MPELTIVTQMGDKELHIKGITLKEMLQIKSWTAYPNKDEWLAAFNSNDPLAIQAAYALAVWRDTGTKPKLEDLDFDLDTFDTRMIDETGQTVELVFETNKDGTLKLDKGAAILSRDKNGRPQLRYTDTGELLPPTEATPTTT